MHDSRGYPHRPFKLAAICTQIGLVCEGRCALDKNSFLLGPRNSETDGLLHGDARLPIAPEIIETGLAAARCRVVMQLGIVHPSAAGRRVGRARIVGVQVVPAPARGGTSAVYADGPEAWVKICGHGLGAGAGR